MRRAAAHGMLGAASAGAGQPTIVMLVHPKMVMQDSIGPLPRFLGFARVAVSVATTIVLTVAPVLAEARVFDLAIRAGALPPEQRVIRVQQGDAVTLRWTSDRSLTLHVHGYDVEQRVTPQTTATMSFTARATGRFPIEIHGANERAGTLAYLEVHPR